MARMPIANSKSIMIEGRLRTAMGDALKSADLCAQQPKAPLITALIDLSARSSARASFSGPLTALVTLKAGQVR